MFELASLGDQYFGAQHACSSYTRLRSPRHAIAWDRARRRPCSGHLDPFLTPLNAAMVDVRPGKFLEPDAAELDTRALCSRHIGIVAPSREGPLEFSARVYLTFSQNFQVISVSFASPLVRVEASAYGISSLDIGMSPFEVRVSISWHSLFCYMFTMTPRFRLAVGSSTRPTLSLLRVAWCSRSWHIDRRISTW